MNKTNILRIVLGLIMLVFGLNGFFNFIPQPDLPETAIPFIMGLAKSGYFFPLLKVTEVICGLFLLLNVFVPLALTILAPIVLNIFLFHTFLAPDGFIMGAVILILELALAWFYKDSFCTVLKKKTDV